MRRCDSCNYNSLPDHAQSCPSCESPTVAVPPDKEPGLGVVIGGIVLGGLAAYFAARTTKSVVKAIAAQNKAGSKGGAQRAFDAVSRSQDAVARGQMAVDAVRRRGGW